MTSRNILAVWFGLLYLVINLIHRAKIALDIHELKPRIMDIYYKNPILCFLRKYFVTVPALILYLTFIEIIRLANLDLLLPSFMFFVILSSVLVILDLGHKMFEILRGDFQNYL